MKKRYFALFPTIELVHLPTPIRLNPINLLQILSLDVVLGACVGTMFIAKFLVVTITFASLIALALCVWLIYTADHLRDAYRLKKRVAHTARHRYHQTRFKTIAIAWAVVAAIGIVVLFFIPLRLLYYGIGLTGAVIVYFVLTHRTSLSRWFPKEFMTALLYTIGVFLPVLTCYSDPLYWNVGVLFSQYFFLALGNLLLFSWFEVKADQLDQHESFALSMGRPLTRNIILLCLGVVIVSALFMLLVVSSSLTSTIAQGTVIVMGLILLTIMMRPAYFQAHDRYRLIGDGVFLVPIIPLLLL